MCLFGVVVMVGCVYDTASYLLCRDTTRIRWSSSLLSATDASTFGKGVSSIIPFSVAKATVSLLDTRPWLSVAALPSGVCFVCLDACWPVTCCFFYLSKVDVM